MRQCWTEFVLSVGNHPILAEKMEGYDRACGL